jgi:hypothetical protein
MLSMLKAAEKAGVSKATIFRAIKSGRLSADRREDGTYAIDPAELSRVYPPQPEPERTVPEEQRDTGAGALIRALERQIDDLRSDRDAWRAQAERLAIAGPHQAAAAPRGLLARLFGG